MMRVGWAGLFSPSGTEITVEDSIFSKNTADNRRMIGELINKPIVN